MCCKLCLLRQQTKYVRGSKSLQTEGRGCLGGVVMACSAFYVQVSSYNSAQVSSLSKAATTAGLHRSQHEMRISGFAPALGCVTQRVPPSPGTAGHPPKKHRGRGCATCTFPSARSPVAPALLLFLACAHTPQTGTGTRDTGSIPGIAADLPRELGEPRLSAVASIFG